MEVGIQTVDLQDGVAAASQAGNCDSDCARHLSGVSQQKMAQAAADWVNAHGGLAGRTVKLVVYSAKVTDEEAQGDAYVAASACAAWTQDHHVSALVLPNLVNSNWLGCAVKNRLPLVSGDFGNYVPDVQELRAVGTYFYLAPSFNLDRVARYYVDALADQGFITANNKIGLLYDDSVVYGRVVNHTLIPELKRRGLTLAASGSFSNSSSTAADWSNYVLHFKSAHVDRVLDLGGYNYGLANFAKAAQQQNYYPKYGVSTLSGPNEMTSNGFPAAELKGAQGVGWMPYADVASTGDAAEFNPAAAQCKKIMTAAAQPWNSGVWRMEMTFCDAMSLLKAVADRAGTVDVTAMSSAADTLGTTYMSPFMWKTDFRPGDHTGAMYLRNLAFDSNCSCFRYSGPMYLPHW